MKAGVVTVSDRVSRGQAEDRSGDVAAEILSADGWDVAERQVVPDEVDLIAAAVVACCEAGCEVVVLTGGTGLSARDVTPEAVRTVIDREVPGMAEAMRAVTFGRLPVGMLSRQVAGTRGRSLVLALPGSPNGVREGLEAVKAAFAHAVEILSGQTRHGTT